MAQENKIAKAFKWNLEWAIKILNTEEGDKDEKSWLVHWTSV